MGGGGPSNEQIKLQEKQIDTTSQLTQEQIDLARSQQAQAAQDTAERKALQQPLIDKETALASGDRSKALAAAMPTISTLSQGYNAAKEQIMSSLPPGPGRDSALANLETQKYTGIAGAQASQVQAAPEILANIGSGVGAFSLQELGAALSGFSGATSSTNVGAGILNNEVQQQEAAKANQLGFFGQLAGAAGTAAGGWLGKSDRRAKENVVTVGSVIDRFMRVRVVHFNYIGKDEPQVGVIAQEVQKCFPETVYKDPNSDLLMVNYGMLMALALRAVQELKSRYDLLEMENMAFRENICGEVSNLSQTVSQLQQVMSNIGQGKTGA